MANEALLPLKQILDSLSNIYPGVTFKFYTSSYEWIVDTLSYNTPFCTMVQNNRKLNAKCATCDQQGLEIALSTRRSLSYKCHMGITEFVYPIFKDQHGLGVFFVGQFLTKPPEEKDDLALRQLCAEHGMDCAKMSAALNQLKILDESKLCDFSTILQLCEYYVVNHDSRLLDDQSVVKQVDDYLDKHLSEHLSLETLAQQVSLSPTYLSAVYKKRTKMTLFKSIQKKRVFCACFLLRTTDKNISEIALDVGFSDQNYFTRLFREHMHVTPRYYREHWEEIEKGRNLQIFFLPER